MELVYLLSDHGENTLVRVIGIGSASTAESALKAFEAAGGTEVSPFPRGVFFFQLLGRNRVIQMASTCKMGGTASPS